MNGSITTEVKVLKLTKSSVTLLVAGKVYSLKDGDTVSLHFNFEVNK
jgi:hypothetical protein